MEDQDRPIVNQMEKGKEYVRYTCGLVLEWKDDNPKGRAKDNPMNNCPGCGAPAFTRFIYNCKGDLPPLENVRR